MRDTEKYLNSVRAGSPDFWWELNLDTFLQWHKCLTTSSFIRTSPDLNAKITPKENTKKINRQINKRDNYKIE